MKNSPKAIVFGYGEMGIRCLKTVLDRNIKVALVVTHEDSPNENIWFDSLKKTAGDYDIPVLIVDDAKDQKLLEAVKQINPDFIFSFYYRFLLPNTVLEIPNLGAYNMHGSMLPQYRGRAPTNWAISHGAKSIGATLHKMTAKADAGLIIDQMSFPILADDLAHEVFAKTLTVAEIILHRSLPGLIHGTAPQLQNKVEEGSYWGRRKPEDGRLTAQMGITALHNLIRAVAPPFPGAFFVLPDQRKFYVQRTILQPTEALPPLKTLCIYKENSSYYLQGEKGLRLKILDCGFDQLKVTSAQDFFAKSNIKLPWSLG